MLPTIKNEKFKIKKAGRRARFSAFEFCIFNF